MCFFQSPWAIIFKNKIIMTVHEFKAAVYGLNRTPFSVELVIFGTKIK